jgi:multidrug resistance efflux pump
MGAGGAAINQTPASQAAMGRQAVAEQRRNLVATLLEETELEAKDLTAEVAQQRLTIKQDIGYMVQGVVAERQLPGQTGLIAHFL